MKDAKEGTIVAGGNGEGNSLVQLHEPRGMIVDHLGRIYVADYRNLRVIRWYEGGKEGNVIISGSYYGSVSDLLKNPSGLSFDREGNLYVVDTSNHRVQKFDLNLD